MPDKVVAVRASKNRIPIATIGCHMQWSETAGGDDEKPVLGGQESFDKGCVTYLRSVLEPLVKSSTVLEVFWGFAGLQKVAPMV